MVKTNASKLPEKQYPRCLADGNKLLRFYGIQVERSLGLGGLSNLCTSEECSTCCIIRYGFSTKKEVLGEISVFTTSTSGRTFESISIYEQSNPCIKKALLVCRVIVGRVQRPLDWPTSQDLTPQPEKLAYKLTLKNFTFLIQKIEHHCASDEVGHGDVWYRIAVRRSSDVNCDSSGNGPHSVSSVANRT